MSLAQEMTRQKDNILKWSEEIETFKYLRRTMKNNNLVTDVKERKEAGIPQTPGLCLQAHNRPIYYFTGKHRSYVD